MANCAYRTAVCNTMLGVQLVVSFAACPLSPQSPIPDMFAPCEKPREYVEASTLPDVLETTLDPGAACSCGLPLSAATKSEMKTRWKTLVYSLTWVKQVTIVGCKCACGKEYFNVDSYGLLNHNNVDIFSHELLRW